MCNPHVSRLRTVEIVEPPKAASPSSAWNPTTTPTPRHNPYPPMHLNVRHTWKHVNTEDMRPSMSIWKICYQACHHGSGASKRKLTEVMLLSMILNTSPSGATILKKLFNP